mmetsp:Transcript_57487/g.147841  ORF Transcript_57487/g.147841 Transcript_57487/m.147841 type:complete len:526 (+) Transcript_57487:457-2034(+)
MSSAASSSGTPGSPLAPIGQSSTRRVPCGSPRSSRILASSSFSSCSFRLSSSTWAMPIIFSTCTGSHQGSSSFVSLSTTSAPSSSNFSRSSRMRKTRFSSFSGSHSYSSTPSCTTAAATLMPLLELMPASSIFMRVSRRCGLPSSSAMRLASLTSGITTVSCSSTFCMSSCVRRCFSSSAVAFFTCDSSSSICRSASSSALRFLSSNSRCIFSISSTCSLARCAAAASPLASASAFCRSTRSISSRNEASRCCTSASASASARAFASSASRTCRSSSSARFLLAATSSADGPPKPPAPDSSLRARAKLTCFESSSCASVPRAGSMKTKRLGPNATRSPCDSATCAPAAGLWPFTQVVAAPAPGATSAHLPPEFTTTACSCWMPAPVSTISGALLTSLPTTRPTRVFPGLKANCRRSVSRRSSLRFENIGSASFCAFSRAFSASSRSRCAVASASWSSKLCFILASSASIASTSLLFSSSSALACGPAPSIMPFRRSFSSFSCRISASCGFSFTTAEFLIRLARSA